MPDKMIVGRDGKLKPVVMLPDPSELPLRGDPGPPGRDAVSIPGKDGQGFNWRGSYRRQLYHPFDCVTTDEGSFVCLKETKSEPHEDNPAWGVLALNGKDGKNEYFTRQIIKRTETVTTGGGGESEPIAAIFDDATVRGQILYVPSDGHVALAQANAQVTAGAIGFSLGNVNAGQAGTYRTEGTLDGFAGLSPGAVYYLSADSAGGWTTVSPSSGFVVVLGRAASQTEFDISILPPVKL